MRRSSSSSFFKPLPLSFKTPRSTSPPPLPHSHTHIRHRPLLNHENRLPLITTLVVGLLFLLSLFSHPDSSISHKFQIPGLLPSKPHSTIHIADPMLSQRINATYSDYLHHCPNGASPICSDPSLTPSQKKRYTGLKKQGKFLLVTNTRQIQDHLPDLLNSIIVLIGYLGKDQLYFSILEGPSSDCTPQILNNVLLPLLTSLGVPSSQIEISTDEPKINWSSHNRIEKIAELRNRALQPLWLNAQWSREITAVVFFNDVYLSAGDILELVFQHKRNGAGITTGMDWWKKKPEYYYDIWVGRTIDSGDLFYPIDNPWWTPSSDLFPNSPPSRSKYQNLSPFQVFSSWNALAILSPEPFLPPYNVRFRRGDTAKGECAASECTLIAGDYWRAGFGRVMVVPSVQLAYERDVASDTISELSKQKTRLGWVDGVPPKKYDEKIDWIDKPPDKVRCHPWPEVNGLSANVWEETRWVDPYLRE
ncbi:hypothetical protein I302_108934 [Kwoniella bestiolae CBS 10118]|uniref:Alpha-1,3-mannosyltransferase CMT1 n=1 Tax=Kwoniella bestiolae CBS 10118 TaxID=1296100 RepID=A0A1B9FUI4_9TREE|nr:alpha-1,3-mannosyltransferase CMT1 [Kwoniella bestiolae CBS 10118]OCF22427.1 alpha-1,3-mannosyltransferase CMT1 [Kwoniella bestiolae CBS 10118]